MCWSWNALLNKAPLGPLLSIKDKLFSIVWISDFYVSQTHSVQFWLLLDSHCLVTIHCAYIVCITNINITCVIDDLMFFLKFAGDPPNPGGRENYPWVILPQNGQRSLSSPWSSFLLNPCFPLLFVCKHQHYAKIMADFWLQFPSRTFRTFDP
jgi:hypothetical protein